jgi:peptide-methionine (S)-S-oxide reductase
MRQGNDVGTQYRSLIGTFGRAQAEAVRTSRAMYQQRLTAAGEGEISTEVVDAPAFYFAEPYHQQYLDANPRGYCGLQGTGVSCPIGTGVTGAPQA